MPIYYKQKNGFWLVSFDKKHWFGVGGTEKPTLEKILKIISKTP